MGVKRYCERKYFRVYTFSSGFKFTFLIVFHLYCLVKVVFTLYIFSRILKNAKICTARKYLRSQYCERKYFRAYTFRDFEKTDNFAWIYIRVFSIIAYIWHDPSYFHAVHIFSGYLGNANYANIYSWKMSTFTLSE